MAAKSTSTDKVYQLKVTLRRIQPPIWRRLLVSGDATLLDLHKTIQLSMGWTESHLHQFTINGDYYSIPSDDDWQPVIDERRHRLADIAPTEKCTFLYEYDFGDNWEHDILVEQILPAAPDATYPRCLKGMRACPPEDVGGTWGFGEFLEAMKDPNHEEHASYKVWWGGIFDPEAFDLEETNAVLSMIDEIDWYWDTLEQEGTSP